MYLQLWMVTQTLLTQLQLTFDGPLEIGQNSVYTAQIEFMKLVLWEDFVVQHMSHGL